MAAPEPRTEEWFAKVDEDVVEPDLAIVDAHHHLWPADGALPYSIADLRADCGSGHRVVQTVFMECGAAYDRAGGDLAPVGETEFVVREAATDPDRRISGIVGHADLRSPELDAVLDAHEAAGAGMFRGIRHALSSAVAGDDLWIPGRAPKGMWEDPAFQRGVARLGERGLTYDSWHYFHQNHEFLGLARAVPGTTLVLDHFGTPMFHGRYAAMRDDVIAQWERDITAIAACPNVVAKLGGLAMPDNGFGWHTDERPPTSDELAAAHSRFYLHTIEAFGPERCMVESNFPVDRFSVSYRVLFNSMKKMTAGYSPAEREAMFSGTARRVYRLPVPQG